MVCLVAYFYLHFVCLSGYVLYRVGLCPSSISFDMTQAVITEEISFYCASPMREGAVFLSDGYI